MPKYLPLLLTVLLMGVTACATDTSGRRLEENLYAYESAIRWSDYMTAAKFIHPDDRPSAQQMDFQISRLENMKVVGYESKQQLPGAKPGTAENLVELRVVNKHTMSERIVRDRQHWRWDEQQERWWLVSGLPNLSR